MCGIDSAGLKSHLHTALTLRRGKTQHIESSAQAPSRALTSLAKQFNPFTRGWDIRPTLRYALRPLVQVHLAWFTRVGSCIPIIMHPPTPLVRGASSMSLPAVAPLYASLRSALPVCLFVVIANLEWLGVCINPGLEKFLYYFFRGVSSA